MTDLYQILSYLILIAISLVLAFLMYRKVEISLLFYFLSTWIAALFFVNEEIWINVETETEIQGYLRAGLLALIGIIGYYKYFINWKNTQLKIPNHILYLGLFLVYSFISLIYSIDPRYTLIRVGLLSLTFGFFLYFDTWLKNKESIEKVLNLIFYLFTTILVITLIVTVIFPGRVWWWQEPNRFIGIGVHPAELGSISMIFYPILLFRISKANNNQKVLLYTLLFLIITMHFFTGSRTTIGASLVGFFIWLFLTKKWSKLVISFVATVLLIIMLYSVLPKSFTRTEGEGILHLTGREMIWEGASKLFWEKPIIGYGYRVEAKIFENQSIYDISDTFFIASAQQPLHGGYLSIAIGGGIIGLSLWLLVLFTPIVNTLRSGMSELKAVLIVIMLSIMITNITETALTGYQGVTDVFFWIIWIMAGKIWKMNESSIERNEETLLNQN